MFLCRAGVIERSDARVFEELSWGCGGESQFRQILTGVLTGGEIRLSLKKKDLLPQTHRKYFYN